MKTSVAILLALFAASQAGAQANDAKTPVSLVGRNSLAISVGLSGTRSAQVSSQGTSAETSRGVGEIAFTHWFDEQLAVDVSVGVLDARASAGASGQSSSAIIPVLLGIGFYPTRAAIGESIRPFAALAGGPYTQFVASNTALGQAAWSETVFGARLWAGIDWIAARAFKLGASSAYDLVPGFRAAPGRPAENHSGLNVFLSAGWLFGGSR